MKEPLRLTDREPGSIAAELLRVARGEAPPAGAHERTLAALGVEPGAARASRIVPAHPRRRAAWMWGAAIAAIVFGVAAHELHAGRWFHAAAVAPQQSARVAVAAAPVVQRDAPPVPTVTTKNPSNEAAAEPRLPEGTQPSRTSDSGKRASRLAAEVTALDAVRRAVTSRDVGRATALLDGYAVGFPRGSLSQEATILHVETLLLAGKRARAEKLASDFLNANPRSGYRIRIERLFAGGTQP